MGPRAARFGLRSTRDRRFESRLAWLLGSPRSGTTWLLNLLSEHPAVASINEPLIGDHLGPLLCDRPGVRASDFDASNFTLLRLRRGARPYFFADEFRDVWQPPLRTLMLERFRAHVERYPPAVAPSRALVVVKEPNGSQAADVIMASLPRSRLLFMVRDGRDVIDSQLASMEKGSWLGKAFPMVGGIDDSERVELAVESAYKWLWRTEVIEETFNQHPGPKLAMRYEDLRERTADELRRVLDWLELRLNDDELEALIRRHEFERLAPDVRGPKQFIRAAQPGLWRERFSERERTAVERVIGPKLRELGYTG